MTKIAVNHKDGNVFQHFGQTTEFKIYDIEDGKIIKSEVVDTNGAKHQEIITFLLNQNINTVILGAMCMGARARLMNANIQFRSGAEGNCDEIVERFLNGTLVTEERILTSCHAH